MLIPRQTVPGLKVETLDHGAFDLATAQPERGTMVVFYRGFHCPICAMYLKDLDAHVAQLAERGIDVIAVSSDTEDRARKMADQVGGAHLRYGYGLPLDVAKAWGLYISTSRGKTSTGVEEPALFSEPGIFLVDPKQVLYFGSVQTMPFARPRFGDFIGALDFVIANDYPARGEYTGAL